MTIDIDTSTWQRLMDQAYDRWQQNDGEWSYTEFLDQCDEAEREAVILGTLNYQVCNGGFDQWAYNGYAIKAPEIAKLLRLIGKPACVKVASLIEHLIPYMDFKSMGRFGNPWLADEYEDEYEEEFDEECDPPGRRLAEASDDKYYEIDALFEQEVAQYFEDGRPKKSDPAPDNPLESDKAENPKPVLRLVGEDGDAFSILGKARQVARKAGWSSDKIEEVFEEAKSGDYNHLLQTMMEHFDVR